MSDPSKIQPSEKQGPDSGKDEFNFFDFVSVLYGYRRWIALVTFVVLIIGILYSFLTKPLYYCEAIIAPKEGQKTSGASTFLSQWGSFGGIMASQLGIGNNSLDRLEIIAGGRDLAEMVIVQNNLLPRLFPSLWDSAGKSWKVRDSSDIPTVRDGVEELVESYVIAAKDRKTSTVALGIKSSDPQISLELTDIYLKALNSKIQGDVILEADQNRIFLEKQLNYTSDPMIREKIANMIAFELEKSMLMNSQSFDILQSPTLPLTKVKPKRKIIFLLSILAGFVSALASVILIEFLLYLQQQYFPGRQLLYTPLVQRIKDRVISL